MDSSHKRPVLWKAFSCHDVIMDDQIWSWMTMDNYSYQMNAFLIHWHTQFSRLTFYNISKSEINCIDSCFTVGVIICQLAHEELLDTFIIPYRLMTYCSLWKIPRHLILIFNFMAVWYWFHGPMWYTITLQFGPFLRWKTRLATTRESLL